MTVSNIDCDYDSRIGNTSVDQETETSMVLGGGLLSRVQLRFPLSAITASSTINDSDIQYNVDSQAGMDAGDQTDINAYSTGGIDDPDADTGATKYGKSIGTTTYTSQVVITTGSKSFDLGATADGHIAANIGTPGRFSIALAPGTGFLTTESMTIEAIENAGTDPATLTVDWTAPVSAALTGTAVLTITEADVVAGGKTIIITLTNDTWIAAGALSFDLQRQNIINGMVSAQSETLGWNLVPQALQSVGGVVRTSNTVVTVTLDAFATYNITATETITVTVPSTAVAGGNAVVATPTFTVTAVASGIRSLATLGVGT